MEYTFGMQVPQAPGNVQSQPEPDWPGQGFWGAEQLFQGPPIHILGYRGRRGINIKVSACTLRLPLIGQGTLRRITKVRRGSLCSRVSHSRSRAVLPRHVQLFKLLSLNKIKHLVPQSYFYWSYFYCSLATCSCRTFSSLQKVLLDSTC